MTKDYFLWMDKQILDVCNFSIEDVVGIPLDEYIQLSMNKIVPKNEIRSVYRLLIEGDQAVAMGGLRKLPNGHGEIVRLYTKPSSRGKGFGRAMLEKIIDEARDFHFPVLNLDTGIFMRDAQSLYISNGFQFCDPYDGAEPPPRLLPYWLYMKLKL
ncbi:GNAT family N-acetyltransferase [Polynucleobacter sp. MWH-UH23A]|uniref:GNAT family N-acetyltransferase n=1 Tax=Polynucleobacter sp. MWH-UH23A TaxID=1855613 RepID=UPI003364B5C2